MKNFSLIIMAVVMMFYFAACEKADEKLNTSEPVGTTAVDQSATDKAEELTEKTTTAQTVKETERTSVTTSAKSAEKTTSAPETTKSITTVPESKKVTTTKETTSSSAAKTTGPAPQISVVTDSDIEKIKAGFLKLVNNERAKKGAQKLQIHSALDTAANIRSRELLKKFSHTRPDGQPYYSVLNPNQYTIHGTGENIQYTSHLSGDFISKDDLFTGRDDQIVAAYTIMFNNFKNSPDHYRNMINKDFCDTGIGISYSIHEESGLALFYICQLFGSGSE